MDSHFFDYNATTPLRPEAKAAWCEAVDTFWMNPSSPYRAGSRVKVRLEAARESLASLFKVAPGRVLFNSGATEGNNSVFAYWAEHLPAGARVGVSPTEHPSVLESAKRYFGRRVVYLDLDRSGAVDPERMEARLGSGEFAAVSVMAANNETGALNAWARIARACRSRGVMYHCDASQWIGKMPLQGLDACDFVTGCGHKFGGPRGVGLLLIPESTHTFRSIVGGAQEAGRRAGTEDVAGILAMEAALQAASRELGGHSAEPRDAFIAALRSRFPQVRILCEAADRLWNTVALILPEFANLRWIRALEKRGFWVSAGSACSTGKQGPSPVLAALGVEVSQARRALRISSGGGATRQDWLDLAEAVSEAYADLKSEGGSSTSTVISI